MMMMMNKCLFTLQYRDIYIYIHGVSHIGKYNVKNNSLM